MQEREGGGAHANRLLHGIIPALVTPFEPDEAVDLRALDRVIQRVLAGGVHGVFVLGSQGEFYALTSEEHRAVVAAAVRRVDGRVPVYAGASAITTRDALVLARQAEAEGADAVVMLPPFFIRPGNRELIEHFTEVASALAIPLVLYNQPQRTGVTLAPSLVTQLAAVPNIIGIKDSSANLNLTLEYLATVPQGFAVVIGNDAQILYGLLAGATGAIASTGNVVPELCVAIYTAVLAGDLESARTAQRRLGHLRAAFELGTFPVIVKEALALVGEPVGGCRAPVGPLGPEAREALKEALQHVVTVAGQAAV